MMCDRGEKMDLPMVVYEDQNQPFPVLPEVLQEFGLTEGQRITGAQVNQVCDRIRHHLGRNPIT